LPSYQIQPSRSAIDSGARCAPAAFLLLAIQGPP
jgi:hypothetical protein